MEIKKLHFVALEKTHVKLAFTAKTNRSSVCYFRNLGRMNIKSIQDYDNFYKLYVMA